MKRLIIFLVLIFCFLPISTYAKSYEITDVGINCTVGQDTKITWDEIRSFALHGNFTFGYYDLPMFGYDWFRNIKVLELGKPYTLNESQKQGSYWVEHLEEYHRIHFYYNATDENRNFEFQYTIEGAVKVYEDYGQFYWKMQGDRWDVPVGNFKAVIHLEKPIKKEDCHVWAHGPLNGDVAFIDDSTIVLTAKDIPENTFVEVRLLIPSSYFKTDKIINEKILLKVEAEEKVWAEDANKIREEEQSHDKIVRFWGIFWNVIIYGLFLFLIGFLIYLYLAYGREFRIKKNFEYIREPPSDLPPAELGYLLKNNEMHPHTIQAIILDLIRRKFIKLSEGDGNQHKKDDLVLIRNDSKATDGLTPYELTLYMEILFHETREITPLELQHKIRSNPSQFYTPVENFKKELKSASLEQKFYDKKSEDKSELALSFSILMLVIFILFGVFIPHSSLFLILIPLYWIVANKAITRRSKTGKALFDQFMAFKMFLSDFSQMQNYAPDSIVVWEKYLVYAVMLGVSKKVIELLKVKIDVMKDLDQSYLIGGSSMNMINSLNRLSVTSAVLGSSIGRISRPAPSSRSSSTGSFNFSSFSGGGGGFSGGGGGGGGGSGGGMG